MPNPAQRSAIRLIAPLGFAVIGLAVILPLILLFQSPTHLVAALGKNNDSLSLRYLELMVRMNPEASELRFMLVHKLKDIGALDKAIPVLDGLRPGTKAAQDEAERLRIQLDYLVSINLPADDIRASAARESLLRRLTALSKQAVPAEDLEDFAKMSLALNQPELAATFYSALSDASDGEKKLEFLKISARWWIASGNSEKAGGLLDRAASLSSDPTQSRNLAMEALRTLLGAMAFDRALNLAAGYIEKYPGDRTLLSQCVDLALAANRLELAKSWVRKLAEIAYSDPAVLNHEMDVELAANDVPAALTTALLLVQLTPDDPGSHVRLAQVAGWANRLELALDERVWLAHHGVFGENIVDGMKLAVGTHHDETWLMLAELAAEQGLMSDQGLPEYDTIAQRSSSGQHLEQFLIRYVSLNPNSRAAWITLARAQTRNGGLAAANTTWTGYESRFGASSESTVGHAEALWRMGSSERALSLLASRKAQIPSTDTPFWKLLGDLAWELEQDQLALIAYETLWNEKNADQADVNRLIELYLASGSTKQAIDLAHRASQHFKDIGFLRQAMQIALQESEWEELDALLVEAERTPLTTDDAYWLIRAELMRHRKSWRELAACYEHVLENHPDSVPARVGLLWALIELREFSALDGRLQAWQANARDDPNYWSAYAAGLAALDRPKEALPWFERQAAATPGNLLWLMNYADILSKLERHDSAWRLRRHVLLKLGVDPKTAKGHQDLALRLAYVRLLGEFVSPDAQAAELQRLTRDGHADPSVREFLVGHYLANRQMDAARYWLVKAHEARQSLPAWQELTFALAEGDVEQAKRILSRPGSGLDPITRVEAWKQVKDPARAMAEARRSLDAEPEGRYAAVLREELKGLEEHSAISLGAGWRYSLLGSLGINEYRSALSLPNLPFSDWVSELSFARRNLSFRGNDLNLASYSEEIDLAANLRWPLLGGTAETRVGGNIRDDSSIVSAHFSWNRQISGPEFSAKFDAAYNELPFETSFLRALGVKDLVSFDLTYRISPRNFIRGKAEFHQFKTREQDFLAIGYATEAEIGHILFFEAPFWQIKLQGAWTGNHLADTVPSSLLALGLSPTVGMKTLVPQEYGMLGIGNQIRIGSASGPNLGLETWIGYIWPSKEFAYNARLSAGTNLLTRDDRLSLEAFYASAQSGQPGQAYEGLGVFYRLSF